MPEPERPTQTREAEAPPIIGQIGNRPLPVTQEPAGRGEVMTFTPEQVDLIKNVVARDQNLTDDELKLFLHVAGRRRLDPLAKQIYAIRRKGKLAFQTSIDGFRLIAARTGEYAGRSEPRFVGEVQIKSGKRAPEVCYLSVYRFVQGQRCEFPAFARWDEFYPGDSGDGFMWRDKPYLMLAKVAEAQADRAAFPEELGGLYTDDEMQQAGPSDTQRAEQSVAHAADPLSVALNTPLPGAAGGWGGYAKAPLSSVPTEILGAVVQWATDKGMLAQDALDAGATGAEAEKQGATARRMAEIVRRCEIVAEARVTGEVAEPPHKDGTPRAQPSESAEGKAAGASDPQTSPTDSTAPTSTPTGTASAAPAGAATTTKATGKTTSEAGTSPAREPGEE